MPRHYKKSVPAVDWAVLLKYFPTHAEHIIRIKKQPEKLARLAKRLIAARTKELRLIRDGETIAKFTKGYEARKISSDRGQARKGLFFNKR